MQYTSKYQSSLGEMLLAADEEGLTGVWFEGQKYYALNLEKECEEKETAVIKEAKKWLDAYFAGENPEEIPKIHLIGTEFQNKVWNILMAITYGKTTTYGEIAAKIAKAEGIKSMSAQAVGGAVGHNPISVIVPCHRVIGSNGSLTGYAGGIDRKRRLLAIEGMNTGV